MPQRMRRAEFGRETTHRAHHESGERPCALSARRGGLADPARERRRDGSAAGLGIGYRGPARQAHCGRRAGATSRGNSLRDVAGSAAVRRGTSSPAAVARSVAGQGPRRNRLTDVGVASASQLMAAGESRELVGAVHSIAHPSAPRSPHLAPSANRRLSSSSRTSRKIEDCLTASALRT